jgi:HEAT repeat protein
MRNFKDPKMATLALALRQQDPATRRHALWEMIREVEVEDMDALIDQLVSCLQDQDTEVRTLTVSAIGNIKDKRIRRTVTPLTAAAGTEQDWVIRLGMVKALQKMQSWLQEQERQP